MPILKHLVQLKALLPICAITLGVCLSNAAYSTDSPLEEPPPPRTALSKLQDITGRASEMNMRAMSMICIKYKYGGNVPESGLDCSGLVRYLFKEVWNTNLPRTSKEISQVGQQVDTKDLQPGDLVFYNTLRRGFSHVGIYLGDNKFIHAPSTGGKVRIESMDASYWRRRFNGARRINEPDQN